MVFNYISVQNYLSPFKTEEEKQVRPIYQAAMKEVSGFKLTYISFDTEFQDVCFWLELKNNTASNSFNEQQLQAINQAVEQLTEYLNESVNKDSLYTGYILKFQIGNSDIQTTCYVGIYNNRYEFLYLINGTGNYITDYHMMNTVRLIDNDGGYDLVFENENISKFSDFQNLEKISFDSSSNYERVIKFSKAMRTILPKCKIFINEEEVLITE